MNKIVTGIVGDGLSSSRHAHEINVSDGFSLLALAPRDRKKGVELGRIHHIPFVDRDPEYLLERDEIDAVVIALPTEKHADFIRYVTSFSKIAVSEAPLSLNPGECRDVLRMAEEGEYIFYAEPYLYLPQLGSISSSFHTFSLEFSSINMKIEETVQIAFEVLIHAFGDVESISKKEGNEYSVKLERGEGTLHARFASDLEGLTLTVDGKKIVDSLCYYDALSYFYPFLYSRIEKGGETESVLRTALEASIIREKILPLSVISK